MSKCSIHSCSGVKHAKGLCKEHYEIFLSDTKQKDEEINQKKAEMEKEILQDVDISKIKLHCSWCGKRIKGTLDYYYKHGNSCDSCERNASKRAKRIDFNTDMIDRIQLLLKKHFEN